MSENSSICSAKAGLTLVEVLAALALLSTLLVGILMASNRHTEQIRRSRQTLEVLHRVDALLYRWTGSGGMVPRKANGQIPGRDELIWKTHVVSKQHRQRLGIELVRLEVFPERGTLSEEPIVALDLAVPAAEWPPTGE